MNLNLITRKALALLLGLGSLACLGSAHSAPLSIADTPLFLTTNVAPNVVVTLDDSGSMSRAFTPDICGNDNAICIAGQDASTSAILEPRYLKASHYNSIYYNPAVTYTAPVDASGTALATTFSNAWVNGYAHVLPDINPDSFDLETKYQPTAGLFLNQATTKSHQFMRHYGSDVQCKAGSAPRPCQYNSTVGTGTTTWVNMESPVVGCTNNSQCRTRTMPAYYYVFDAGNSNCTGTAAQMKVDNDCYDIRIVSATSGADRDGVSGISAAEADERQNFANWYSFYRTRNLATIASASLAYAEFDASTRVAWQALNTCRGSSTTLVDTNCEGWGGNLGFSNAIKPFTGTHKQNFYTWLFRLNTNTSTPLREAMQRAGDYYSNPNEGFPYDDDLITAGTVTATSGTTSCRKNFHIMMTDGIWNGGISTSVGDTDGNIAPYADGNSDSLADIAYYYWNTDLVDLPGNDNNLLPYIVEPNAVLATQTNNPKNDPKTTQHMVNFTVGLGLTPFLESVAGGQLSYAGGTYSGSYSQLLAGTKSWPTTGANLDGNVADLWHAALNSRGQFFSAESPDSLVDAFAAVKNAIELATPSAAALAANSTSIQTGAQVYQAAFNSKDWSGDLIAFPVGTGGGVGTAAWNAAAKLPAAASRSIYTIDGISGVTFDWTSLNAGQKSYLNTDASGNPDTQGSDRLDWVRGVQTQEVVVTNGLVVSGVFRKRSSVLGDIINSDPAFAHADDFGYSTMGATEAASYAPYVTGKATRTAAVFVGANDGMLHAFRADSSANAGTELFAYVPNGVFQNLSKLTDPGYAHKYFVDGGPTVGDAHISGNWATVLVGGLGGGGQSIYALNVSNVTSPSASMVMWEYTESDMGFTYSKPQIARLNNGKWVAIFGNGYNSASERAYLYVVDLEDGSLVAKIAAGTATANGLSTPALYDSNNDKIIDFAYAGDLQGNLWKFDLTSFANQTTPQFVARNASNDVQAITAQPVIGGHPNGNVLVYFGTGQYLQGTDPLNVERQSFYAIWDNGSPVTSTDRSELQVQTIINQTSQTFTVDDKGTVTTTDDVTETSALRETSANTVDWTIMKGWYMDFDEPSSKGERIVTQALLKHGRVIFLTLIPSTDTCDAGGDSWLMELDAITGARTTDSSFDFNNDGQFDSADNLTSGSTASGVKTTVGITKPPAWFTGTGGKDYKIMTGTTGGIQSLSNKGPIVPPGGGGTLRRTYWIQIQ